MHAKNDARGKIRKKKRSSRDKNKGGKQDAGCKKVRITVYFLSNKMLTS